MKEFGVNCPFKQKSHYHDGKCNTITTERTMYKLTLFLKVCHLLSEQTCAPLGGVLHKESSPSGKWLPTSCSVFCRVSSGSWFLDRDATVECLKRLFLSLRAPPANFHLVPSGCRGDEHTSTAEIYGFSPANCPSEPGYTLSYEALGVACVPA